MTLRVAGANHKSAPLEKRERIAVARDELPQRLGKLAARCRLDELVILSTCNRVEFYFRGDAGRVTAYMAERGGFPAGETHGALYSLEGRQAAEHLFSVACGLDSMVLGETQILRQCKDAYEAARAAGTTGAVLNAVFQQAFETAKKVHTETGLSSGRTSVGSVAASLVEEAFGSLEGRSVVLVGAGTMAKNMLYNLSHLAPARIVVANRSVKRARELAGAFGGRAARLSSTAKLMAQADVLVTSAGGGSHIVTGALLRRIMRGRGGRKLLIIDIAVPRNVEPSAMGIDGVELLNIDSLQEIADKNAVGRESAVAEARRLVAADAQGIEKRLAEREVVPVILAMQEKAASVAAREVKDALRRLKGGARPEEEMESLAEALTKRFLHDPVAALKKSASSGDAENLSEAARKLHGLGKNGKK